MKKKELTRKLSLYIAILIFGIVCCESVIYYKEVIDNKIYLVFQAISDGVRIFGIDSSIDIIDALESGNSGAVSLFLNNAYVICYFLAPLLTVKFVAQFIGYIVKERLIDFNFSIKKERVLIIGYNDYVEKLLKNILYKSNNPKKYKLLVLHKNDITEKIKFRFQMAGVSFQMYEKLDYENQIDTKFILKWIKPKKVVRVMLFEENGMDNVSNYCFLLKCFEQKKSSDFIDNLKIDCNYDLSQIEDLIWDCYDRTKLKYSMNTFSIPMLRAQSVLDNVKIYNDVISDGGECNDIHLMIIGFGKMGRRFFKRAINESIVSEKNNIIVDIIEKDDNKIKAYLRDIDERYYGSEENTIHIKSADVDGDLKIKFHRIDVKDKQFISYMEDLSLNNPFTYIAICVDRPEVSVFCMHSVEDYLKRQQQKIPVLVRMDSGQQLKMLEKIYPNLKLVPGDDEILTFENIDSTELQMVLEEIHRNDNEKQKKKAKLAYEIESSKYRVLHYKAKKAVYDKLSESDKKYMREIFTSSEYTDVGKYKEFINTVKDNDLLFKFGAIEHRRWSYYVISCGWSYGEEKDKTNKVTPCLCPFDTILNNKDEKIKKSAYDEYKDWSKIITK